MAWLTVSEGDDGRPRLGSDHGRCLRGDGQRRLRYSRLDEVSLSLGDAARFLGLGECGRVTLTLTLKTKTKTAF